MLRNFQQIYIEKNHLGGALGNLNLFILEPDGVTARLLQGIASSNDTIAQSLIMSRFTDTDSSYIEYLPLPQVVTVLDSPEHHNRSS